MALLGKRVLLIANPGSRGGARLVDPAVEAFRQAGVSVDVIITQAAGHGGRAARESAEEYDLIFTLGGDGTAMEVVHALAGTNRSVGILPGGTGNLIARVLRIPIDVRRAVPALLNGTRIRIDLGVLGDGRPFAVAAGAGVDADMIAAAPLAMRRRFGALAYVATAAQSLWRMTPFAVRAAVDGKVIERDDCVCAMIVNMGSVFDGLLELGPGISHVDGQLDLCVFSARGLAEAAVVAGRLVMKDFGDDRHMTFARGRRLALATVPPRAVEADGEMIGDTPISAHVEPLAAPLLVPRA